jgi:hypothetical protein
MYYFLPTYVLVNISFETCFSEFYKNNKFREIVSLNISFSRFLSLIPILSQACFIGGKKCFSGYPYKKKTEHQDTHKDRLNMRP